MRSLIFFPFLILIYSRFQAQLINCSNNSIYIHNGTQIVEQPTPMPAASSTLLASLPAGSNGLAIGPAFGFSAPDPTFWTTANGTYWYYNGTSWINTNHTTGNTAALNLGASKKCLYNLVGNNGQVYIYNGTGNGTFHTTLQGFNGAGPYDINADANDNLYVVKATTPNPSLIIYNNYGVAICSYSLSNLPAIASGGGFAIVNDFLAVHNSSFSVGKIYATSPLITFTAQSAITAPFDFANCVIPVPTGLIDAPRGSVLDCNINNLPLVAKINPGGIGIPSGSPSSSLASGSFSWSGPGIISGQNTATVDVDQPGVYSFTVFSTGCPIQQVTQSFTVTSTGLVFTPTISAPACFSGSGNIRVSPNTATNTISWTGPSILNGGNSPTISIGSAGVYAVSITNTLGCTGVGSVFVQASPALSVALSSNSICAQAFNNSPIAFSVTPFGANTYTLLTGLNFSANTNAPWNNSYTGPPQTSVSTDSVTIIGAVGQCTSVITTSFNIIPNPSISVSPQPATMCFGTIKTLSVNGAGSYTWIPAPGLSLYSGPSVNVSPLVSTVYSVLGSDRGCSSATRNLTVTVLPLPSVFISPPSATVCTGNNTNLTASGSASSYTWSSSAGSSAVTGFNMISNPATFTTYTVIGALNSCTNSATATVFTVPPPSLTITLSTNSICAQPINGSPNAIQVTAQGALNYTLLPGLGYSVNSPNSSPMSILSNVAHNSVFLATATLLGSNGYCQVFAQQVFSIVPNPQISSLPTSAIVCPGSSQLFTASGADSYSWSPVNAGLNALFGNQISAGPTVTTIYSVIGERAGCRSVAQSNILNISAIPNISVTASTPTLCAGSAVQLKVTGNATSFNWIPSTGITVLTQPTVNVTPFSSQAYTVVGALNSCTTSAVVSLSVIASPVLSVSASAYTVCSGSSIRLSAEGASNYSWSPSTGLNTYVGKQITATPFNNTTFSVSGFNGVCIGKTSVSIKTIPPPQIVLNVSANQLCSGDVVTVHASGAQYYTWSPQNGLSDITGQFVTATPMTSTIYTVSGINSNGTVSCFQQVYFPLTVLPKAQANLVSYKRICEGETAALSVSGGDTYIWQPAKGLNKTGGSRVNAKPDLSTVYTVQSSFGGNCVATNTVMVEVLEKPIVDAGRDTTFNADQPMTIAAKGDGSLQWIFGDGIVCNNCGQTAILPRISNCYRVEATNSAGCKSSDDVCVTVTENFSAFFPNSFTPNGDGLNDVFLILGQGISDVKLDIYNKWGERLFSSNDQDNGWDGTLKGLACDAGVYTYNISYKGLNNKHYSKTGSITLVR